MKNTPTPELGETLAEKDYIQRRTTPRYRDIEYLQLKDLYDLLLRVSPSFTGDVFDYGCGGAPYRQLFAQCKSYVKADVTPGPAVDRLLSQDGLTQEASASYDWVVSTQVLEHVREPAAYMKECHRILRPGGRLIVTTHGFVEEHGCPYDFQRWTGRGLEELAVRSGFRIIESGKLTTELRAVCQLSHQLMLHLRCDGRPLIHYPLAVFRMIYFKIMMPLLNAFGSRFSSQSVASADSPSSLYTGVFVVAEKVK